MAVVENGPSSAIAQVIHGDYTNAGSVNMVRLVSTSNIQNTLESLGDVKHAGSDLPLELLETIQQHLESKQPWVEHKLLAQIARWNKARSSQYCP